jgi:hypothetical protein
MNKHSEILAALAAPFPPEVIRHRPGVGGKDLTWVDARTVAARLDEVLGISAWDFAVEPVGETSTVVGILTLRFPDGSVARRQDFGYETGGSGESLKEASSDALRRCASLFGVARYLYAGANASTGRIPAPTGIPAAPARPAQPARAIPEPQDTVVLKAAVALFQEDQCPEHGLPWSQKPAGISKAGKAYAAFWTCSGKTDGQWCRNKPSIAWVNRQSEPIGAPAEGTDRLEDLPF